MNLPKPSMPSMPSKERIGKEIEKTEGTIFVQGLLLVTLLALQLALPEKKGK